MRLLRLLAIVVPLILSPASRAQPISPDFAPRLAISLLTIGPGPAAYEQFGHNALIVRDTVSGRAIAYNYGVFDFDQENFYGRFIQGRLLYSMEAYDADAVIKTYIADDRSVWIQDLDLTPPQRLAIFDYLEGWRGRNYLYDYYTNNCSTQVRDALDIPGALDGALKSATAPVHPGHSFRWHTRRLTQVDPPLYLALESVLGLPTDLPISRWNELFLPQELQAAVSAITLPSPDGSPRPLVAAERQLHRSSRYSTPVRPPIFFPYFLAIGLAIAVALLGFRGRTMTFLASTWCLLIGATGWLCVWGWFFTDHWATKTNLNLLHLNPLAIFLPLLIPAMRRRWANRRAPMLANAIAFLACVGLLMAALPHLHQYNWDVACLTLPVWLALAIALRRRRDRILAQRDPAPPAAAASRLSVAGAPRPRTSPSPSPSPVAGSPRPRLPVL